jgi:uncharacterized delta-60 repeat protein
LDGSLDPTCAGNGKVLTDFPRDTSERARGLALDSQGRAVTVGFRVHDGQVRGALARYLPDGRLDPSFGRGGMVRTNLSSEEEGWSAVAIDALDRIVAAGWAKQGGGSRFVVARYAADGKLDATFSGNGLEATAFPRMLWARALAIAIDASGRILVAGGAGHARGTQFALARYKEDGSLDPSFDGDGRVTTDFTGSGWGAAHAVALDAGGRIVLGGWVHVRGVGYQFALARYKQDGSLDDTFDDDGRVTTDFPDASREQPFGMAIDGAGRIVLAGRAHVKGVGYEIALARYKEDGDLDSTFDGDGRVTTDFARSGSELAFAVAIDPGDRIVVAGRAHVRGAGYRLALARYKEDGSLDPTFDGDGMVTTDFAGSRSELAQSAAIDATGKVVVAGSANVAR